MAKSRPGKTFGSGCVKSNCCWGYALQAVADANRGKWNANLAFLQGVVYANAEAY